MPSTDRPSVRVSAEAALVGLLFVTVGIGGVMYAARPWLPPVASRHGLGIDAMLIYLLFVAGGLFLAGHLVLTFLIWRASRQQRITHRVATRRTELTLSVTLGLLVVSLGEAGVLAIGIPVWNEYFMARPPEDALFVEVTGQQFSWNVRYPGNDGILGRTNVQLMDAAGTNPLGIDHGDPAAADDITLLNEMTVPVNRPVRVRLRSKDVIHSFFLPHLRVKQDAVPGMTPEIVFVPTREGNFEIVCAELCGLGALPHAGGPARALGGWLPAVDAAAVRDTMADLLVEPRAEQQRHGHTEEPLGFVRRYIFSTDHKIIGIQYILTGLFMAVVGALLAALIRLQLGWPTHQWTWLGQLLPTGMPSGVMTPEFYLAVVTMHGTIMVFFFISYVLVSGFGNYLVPLQVGARDMAFPFLNMLSYWVALLAALIMLGSFFVTGGAAAVGLDGLSAAQRRGRGGAWLAAGDRRSGSSAMALFIASFTMSGLNIVATVFSLRAPGMSMMRMPLTVWSYFIASIIGAAGVSAAHRRRDHAAASTDTSGRASSCRRGCSSPDRLLPTSRADRRCCGSTSSGFSAIPRCTSSSCRRSASSCDILPVVHTQADVRLPHLGLLPDRGRRPQHDRVGPSHVRQRHEPVLRRVLLAGHAD